MSTKTIDEMVADGIEFLDFVSKNTNSPFFDTPWREKIDLTILDQNLASRCVLGQISETVVSPFTPGFYGLVRSLKFSLRDVGLPEHLQYVLKSIDWDDKVSSTFWLGAKSSHIGQEAETYAALTKRWVEVLSAEKSD